MCVSGRLRMRCAAQAARPPAQYCACQPGSRSGSAPSSPLKPRKPVAVCTSSSSAMTPASSASAPQAVTVTSLGTCSPAAARSASRCGSQGPSTSPASVSLAITTSGQDSSTLSAAQFSFPAFRCTYSELSSPAASGTSSTGWCRAGSPPDGSTFTTVAPAPASSRPAYGPAMPVASSSTRIPASGGCSAASASIESGTGSPYRPSERLSS